MTPEEQQRFNRDAYCIYARHRQEQFQRTLNQCDATSDSGLATIVDQWERFMIALGVYNATRGRETTDE